MVFPSTEKTASVLEDWILSYKFEQTFKSYNVHRKIFVRMILMEGY